MLSIVIVHWNTPKELKNQLARLRKSGDRFDGEIIVVDNDSKQKPSWIEKEYPGTTLIQNHDNLGYAAACNQGAKSARGNILLFLNPDVTATLPQILTFVKKGARVYDAFSPEPKDAYAYKKPLPSWLSLLVEFTPLKHFVPLALFRKRTLTGGILCIKKTVFTKIGRWDDRFFLFFEDSDLTQRLYSGGYKVGFVKSSVPHRGGVSFTTVPQDRQRAIFFHSMRLYADKHFSSWGRGVIQFLSRRYTR